jgi:hypothetical protein
VAEQRLDDVDRRVVVEVLGGEHAPAVVRAQHQLAAVAAPGAGRAREPGEAAADLAVGDLAGVPGALQQVGGVRACLLLAAVPAIAGRHLAGAVERLDVADDLADHAAEAVADRDHPRAVELRRLDVQQVVGACVAVAALEHVQRRQLAGLLDPQPRLQQQLEQRPVPEAVELDALRRPVIGCRVEYGGGVLPAAGGQGAQLGHLDAVRAALAPVQSWVALATGELLTDNQVLPMAWRPWHYDLIEAEHIRGLHWQWPVIQIFFGLAEPTVHSLDGIGSPSPEQRRMLENYLATVRRLAGSLAVNSPDSIKARFAR